MPIRLAIFISVLLFGASFASANRDIDPVYISNFTGGLNTTVDPMFLNESESPDLQNVDVWRGRIQKRRGSVVQNSTNSVLGAGEGVTFLHSYIDPTGLRWMISFSSSTLYKSQDGGVLNSVLTSTHGFTSAHQLSAVNAFSRCFLMDGSTNTIAFNGSVVEVVPEIPKGDVCAFAFERLFVAGVDNNESVVYMSRFGDYTDWTNDGIDDADALTEVIRQNDGSRIQALIPFRDSLLIFKDRSIDILSIGQDGLTPFITPLTDRYGTSFAQSVQVIGNECIFMADTGFYKITANYEIQHISRRITETFSQVLQKDARERQRVFDTAEEFDNNSPIYYAVTNRDGRLYLSTVTISHTESADFTGTLTNMEKKNNTIVLSTNSTNLPNHSFETTDLSDWTMSAHGTMDTKDALWARSGGVFAEHGSAYLVAVSTFAGASSPVGFDLSDALVVRVYGYGDTLLTMYPTRVGALSSSGFASFISKAIFHPGAFQGRYIRVEIRAHEYSTFTDNNYLAISTPWFWCNGDVEFWMRRALYTNKWQIFLDNFDGGVTSILSGTYESPEIDVSFTSNPYGYYCPSFAKPSTITYVSNGNSSVFSTRYIDTSSSWSSYAERVDGQGFLEALTGTSKVQYKFEVALTTASSVGIPYLSRVETGGRALLGAYITPAFPIDGITSFGEFNFSDNDVTEHYGKAEYRVLVDTDTVISSTAPLTNASVEITGITDSYNFGYTGTPGIPGLSTGTYARVAVNLSAHDAHGFADTFYVDSFSLHWDENGNSFPVASLVYEDEYHCAVAINSSTHNDTILVNDINGAWVKYTGLEPAAAVIYKGEPHFGQATDGYIWRYQIDNVYNDNGEAIHAKWVSKDFDFGIPAADKTAERYYVTARKSSSNIDFLYAVNKQAELVKTTSLDLSIGTGIFSGVVKPVDLRYSRGILHRFEFNDNDADENFDILSVTILPRVETLP